MKESISSVARRLAKSKTDFDRLDKFINNNSVKIANAFDISTWWSPLKKWKFNKEGNAIILYYDTFEGVEIPISELDNLDEFLRNLKQKREAKKKAEELEWKKNQLNYFAKELNMTVVEK